ncbi:MAG TPA: glycosyltransferase, partial [Puia sp.]
MKLFYFTSSYPYGLGERWKTNELKELVHHFDQITVVPYSYEHNFDNPKKLPEGVALSGPLFRDSSLSLSRLKAPVQILFSRHRKIFISEFFKKRVYRKKSHFVSWLMATLNALRLLDHPVIRRILQDGDDQTILYFFWGKGSAEILPFIDTTRFYRTFVRMHRYDLFETENNNYIPYRSFLLNKADRIAPSSEAGRIHLTRLYPGFQDKIFVYRMGTNGNGKRSSPSADPVFRIVSCSFLSPVKRVDIMVESLRYVDFPVLWRHIGDGKQRDQIEELIGRYSLQEKFILEGMIDSDQVLDFYTGNAIDLFVNTSASEGVPFSIMEAFSVGIPVMATQVGGTAEIVDESVGNILPAGLDPRLLARYLKEYYSLPEAEKVQKRNNAYRRY